MVPDALTLARALCVAAVALAVPQCALPQASGPTPGMRSLRDGAYTVAQAERGATVFASVCASCHVAAAFSDAAFRSAWNGRPVSDLFRLVRTTMPQENPGRLERREYVEVLAYIFTLNGVPSGTVELPADEDGLRAIRMDWVAVEPPPQWD